MPIPQETIDRIKSLSDVVDVVGQVVRLKKTGNHFSGLCPFHREKTPSFKVFPESQNYHCFGCGEGGTVFTFVMQTEGLSFPEAVGLLGERCGVEVETRAEADDPARALREQLHETLALAARYYNAQLEKDGGAAGSEYLERRGLSADTIKEFGLGVAPEGWENLLTALKRHKSPDVVERAGLAIPGKRSPYDRFRNRLMFPIQNVAGQVVGFGGRSLDDSEPKYLNTPETEVYHKSQVLYGLRNARHTIRREERVLVVEGYMDVLALHQGGVTNAVATCGTSLTAEHGRMLARYAPEVVLVFDGDRAGVRAALKAFETLLPIGVRVTTIAMPVGKDPDDVIREEGAEGFAARAEKRLDLVDFFYAHTQGEARPAAIQRLAEMIASIPDAIPRQHLVRRAADWFKFREETFGREVARLRTEHAKVRTRTQVNAPAAPLQSAEPPKPVEGLEAALLTVCLADPPFWAEIQPLMARADIKRTVERRVRTDTRTLLDAIAEHGSGGIEGAAPVGAAAYHDHVTDGALRTFLLRMATEDRPDDEHVYRLKTDLVAELTRLALKDEQLRLRKLLNQAHRDGDRERESELTDRFQKVYKRLNEFSDHALASAANPKGMG
jgi:DNA primase